MNLPPIEWGNSGLDETTRRQQKGPEQPLPLFPDLPGMLELQATETR